MFNLYVYELLVNVIKNLVVYKVICFVKSCLNVVSCENNNFVSFYFWDKGIGFCLSCLWVIIGGKRVCFIGVEEIEGLGGGYSFLFFFDIFFYLYLNYFLILSFIYLDVFGINI